MTDFATLYALGENIDGDFNGGSNTIPVEYAETLTSGNPLKITGTGQNVDNVSVLKTTAGGNFTHFVAILDGDIGDVKEVILQGRTKIELGGTVIAGAPLSVNSSGLFVNHANTNANPVVGFALQSGDSGDLIIIYFNGTLTRVVT